MERKLNMIAKMLEILLLIVYTNMCWGSSKGCVELDSITFDKIVPRFKYSLVKFDIAFPYGPGHEAFEQFALEVGKESDDLLLALVGIKDYGEKDNLDLANRFNVPNMYPYIILFNNKSIEDSVIFPDHSAVSIENVRLFVRKNTDLYIGLPGCVEEYDKLAKKFGNSQTTHPERETLILLAETMQIDYQDEKSRNSIKNYIAIMKKIQVAGEDVKKILANEENRVKNLLNGAKISENKKQDLYKRLNIIESFKQKKVTKKDEL